jgi:FkbM family methyltransferase
MYALRLVTAVRYRLGLVWRQEAAILARRGRFHDAQWAFARASGLTPDSDDSWTGLAQYLEAKGGLSLKIAALQASLGRGGGRHAQSALLVAMIRADRAAEAIALTESISDPDAALSAAMDIAAAGHHAQAERFARWSTVLAPKRADAWFQLGSVYAGLSRYDDAVAALEESISLDPANLTTRATLGQVLAHVGRIEESAKVFQALLRRDPTNADAWAAVVHLASQQTGSRNVGEIARQVAAYLDGEGDEPDGSAPAQTGAAATRVAESRLHLAPALLAILPPDERIVVLDGGARDAHADPRWRELPANRLAFHGFEPDPPECDRLNRTLRELGYQGAYHPIGLWKDDGKLPFHVNKASGGSSFLDQKTAVTDRWRFENPHQTSLAREIFQPERTVEMPVTSIPQWAAKAGVASIDFCKLNVQGAELDILAASEPLLDGMLGVLAETAFVESYVGRPFFSDIDAFMRRSRFTFFDLIAHHYVGRADVPVVAQHVPGTSGRLGQLFSSWGQLIEGHSLYLRDPIDAERGGDPLKLEPNRVIKLAAIAEVFGQVEFAFELVQWLVAALRATGDEARASHLAEVIDRAATSYRGELPRAGSAGS